MYLSISKRVGQIHLQSLHTSFFPTYFLYPISEYAFSLHVMLRAFQSRGWGVGKGDVSSSPLQPKFSFDEQFFADEPFNLIQDVGRGAKRPPYQFFSCNFYKCRIWPKNFLNFSFDPFAKLL